MTRGVELVVVCGLLLTMTVAAWGQPPGGEALATVRWAGEAGDGVHLLGFVADATGHVVAHVDADDPDLVVEADFVVRVAENEYTAQGVDYDLDFGLALLRITTDPPPAPYTFAQDPAEQGRVVYGAMEDANGEVVVRLGSISRIAPTGSESPAMIWHNALAGVALHGAPLFNNCREAIGVIVTPDGVSADRLVRRRRRVGGVIFEYNFSAVLAVPAEWVMSTFDEAALIPVRADERCLSETDRAVSAEEARRLAEGQAALATRVRNVAVVARREAEEMRDAAVAARAAAEAAAETARRYVVWAVAAGALVSALLAGLWLASRRSRARAVQRKRAAEAEAAEARAAVEARDAEGRTIEQTPDIRLTGAGPDGAEITLSVAGREIARPSGVVVGQNPFNGKLVSARKMGKWLILQEVIPDLQWRRSSRCCILCR